MATLAERLSALAPPDADARASASPARPDQSALFDVLAELARATRGSSSDEVKASQRLVEDALLRVTCGGWAGPAVRRAAADVLARLFLAGNPVSLYSCLNHLAAAVRGDDRGDFAAPAKTSSPAATVLPGGLSPAGARALGAAECLARLAASHPSHAAAMSGSARALASAAADLAADARAFADDTSKPRAGAAGRLDAAKFGTKRGARVLRVAAIRLVGAATGACARDRPPATETRRVAARVAAATLAEAAASGPGTALGNRRSASASRARPSNTTGALIAACACVSALADAPGGFRVWTDPPGTLAEGARGEGRGDSGRGDSGRGDSGLERAFPRSIPNASAGTELASLLVRCLEDAD